MSINLYVGNLAYSTRDEGLQEAFEAFGEVTSAKVIMDRETGRSRGFGFVEMTDREAGMNAIEKLQGAEIDGRAISVKEALPREERPKRSFGDRGGRGNGGGGFRPRGPRYE